MLKKTVTYNDYNNVERTEDFYFNLTKAELMEMELNVGGGMSDMLKSIVAAKDIKRIGEIFKEILIKSYGEKSSDGRRFIKNQDIIDAFTQTEAYSIIFTELCQDSDAALDFVRGILPPQLSAQVNL